MLVLITYDVNVQSPQARKRLRNVAKICQKFGQRVQNSVFECVVDASQFVQVKHKLEQTIDPDTDSIRFYNLGNHYQNHVEHIGNKPSVDIEGTLLI